MVCPTQSGVDEGGNSGRPPIHLFSTFRRKTSPFKRQEWRPLNCCSRRCAAVAPTLSIYLASETRSWTGCSAVELNGVHAPSHWVGSRPLTLRARWPPRWVVAPSGPHSKSGTCAPRRRHAAVRREAMGSLCASSLCRSSVLGTCLCSACVVSPSSVPEW